MATTKVLRKIVRIDESKCDGCGLCVPACHEGAIEVIDGKARLVSDRYCDGLGDCLGECPQGAITIEEREANEYDEAAVQARMEVAGRGDPTGRPYDAHAAHAEHGHGGCPGAMAMQFQRPATEADEDDGSGPRPSMLAQWPVQLSLVPPNAPYFQGADLLVTADCVPFAYADYHRDYLKGKALVIGCPKLDDIEFYREKLTAILQASDIKSVTVLHMEVPCCFGIVAAAEQAVAASGKDIAFETVTIGIQGERK